MGFVFFGQTLEKELNLQVKTVGELTNKTHKKHTILFLQQHSSLITTLIFHSLHLKDFVTSLDA